MVINKKGNKIYNFFVLQVTFLLKWVFFSFSYDLARVGEVSDRKVSNRPASIIASHGITESPILLPAYLPFSQLLVEGFQI